MTDFHILYYVSISVVLLGPFGTQGINKLAYHYRTLLLLSCFISLQILFNFIISSCIVFLSCGHLPVSCRSLVNRCGSLGSCKPQIYLFFNCSSLYFLIELPLFLLPSFIFLACAQSRSIYFRDLLGSLYFISPFQALFSFCLDIRPIIFQWVTLTFIYGEL